MNTENCAFVIHGSSLLLRYQSAVDPFMPVRLHTRVGLLYQDLAAAGEIPSGIALPPLLSIIPYNCEKAWRAWTSLDELIEPNLPAQMRRLQPKICFLLLDG